MKGIRWLFLSMLVAGSLAGIAQNEDGGQSATAAAKDPEVQPASLATLADARALAAKGRLDQVLKELNTLAKVEPEEAGTERLRGVILYQKELLPEADRALGQMEDANREYKLAVEIQHKNDPKPAQAR